MISHFAFRAPAGRPQSAPPAPSPAADAADPLAELLGSLRGREVTVQVGSRQVSGRLVLANPVTLIGPAGEVTVIAPGAVCLVRF